MNKVFAVVLTAMLSVVALASAKDNSKEPWMDPAVTRVNALPPHASFFAFESEDLAAKGEKSLSGRYMSLEGMWKFNFVKNHNDAPKGFYALGYDDASWGTFPVPGLFEMNGYGDRIYKNIGYAWATQFVSRPPYIEEKNNYTGSYRRTVSIPKEWKGQRIDMHVGSATSNLKLWVNGRKGG